MAQKTSGEFEKEFMDGLKTSTGKDLAAWIKVVDSCGTKKRNEVIARLKSEHGFGHMNASLLAGIHANGGKPVYQSTDGLLESQFAKAVEMKPLTKRFSNLLKNISRTRPFFPKRRTFRYSKIASLPR